MNNSPSSQKNTALFEELQKLKQSFSFENEEEEKEFYKKNSYLFATTSASLFRLLPQIPYSKHKSIFEKLLFNLQLLTIEERYVENFIENFEIIDTENSLIKAQNGQPFLFCCFHTGAYSIIPALLTTQHLHFGFLSNNTLTQRKGKHFLEVHRNYCQKHKIDSTIQLINVEEKKGIWEALRMLKEGKSLIVYADGNTGIDFSSKNSKKENPNTVRVRFLGEDLQVKQGIAFLSYACKIPIIPIVSSRELENLDAEKPNLKRKYTLLSPIYPTNRFTNSENKNSPKKEISKEEFAEQTLQKLYSILENEITKKHNHSELTHKVSDWEGWIFVNKFFEHLKKPIFMDKVNEKNTSTDFNKDIEENKNPSYIFNQQRFALIEKRKKNQEKQENTLFDKFTYRFFPVSDLLYEVIIYFSIPKKLYLSNEQKQRNNNCSSDFKLQSSETSIPINALEKLIEKNILIQL